MSSLPDWFLPTVAFVLGSIIGSFLNACIHRMPLGISLSNPKRSFCPKCKTPLPWYYNIPLVSYLWLRAKCGFCAQPIPFRYWMVEFLTASLFLSLWLLHGWPLAPAYCLLAALLITATFIDFDHLIIPDEITIGGTALGILCCILFPELMGTTNRWLALGYSVLGAASGFASLWLVVQLGKLAFGKKKHVLKEPTPFRWTRIDESAEIRIDNEVLTWEEIFSRPSDEMVLECESFSLPLPESSPPSPGRLRLRYDALFLPNGERLELDDLDTFSGTVRSVTIPREAMGFGDVKFLAAIGAFLGWPAVLFTIMASSIFGSVSGVATMIITKGKGGGVLPFGPFLALGALLWMLGASTLWNWYISGGVASLFPSF